MQMTKITFFCKQKKFAYSFLAAFSLTARLHSFDRKSNSDCPALFLRLIPDGVRKIRSGYCQICTFSHVVQRGRRVLTTGNTLFDLAESLLPCRTHAAHSLTMISPVLF